MLQAARAACGETAVAALWRMKADGLRAHHVACELGITRRQVYHLAARAEEWLRRHGLSSGWGERIDSDR
jgi:hypothetical protein